MIRWSIKLLACLVLCGCQLAVRPVTPASLEPCPSPDPCGDEAGLPGSPVAMRVAWRPLWPGCPSTIQVMAGVRPIVFQGAPPVARPDEPPSGPSDWVCDPPEAPLLRAGRGMGRRLAGR